MTYSIPMLELELYNIPKAQYYISFLDLKKYFLLHIEFTNFLIFAPGMSTKYYLHRPSDFPFLFSV